MTQLLVRVANAGEAELASAAGFDIVELRFDHPQHVDLVAAKAVRSVFPGLLRLSMEGPVSSVDILESALAIGANELAVTVEGSPTSPTVQAPERPVELTAVALLAVTPDTAELIQQVRYRFQRVMIEGESATRLFDTAGIAKLAGLADACRAVGLSFGFSGALEAPDIARLSILRPDVLGFDCAVRDNHHADGELLPHLLEAIRALVPREGAPELQAPLHQMMRDKIFVRDFVVPISIGAYQAEERTRQRVRFSVEADILRRSGPPRDMRDVFSYDVILETIRVLAARGHVAFVETLAEEVAASVLAYSDIASVSVTVEKLDVVDGSVGVALTRRRAH